MRWQGAKLKIWRSKTQTTGYKRTGILFVLVWGQADVLGMHRQIGLCSCQTYKASFYLISAIFPLFRIRAVNTYCACCAFLSNPATSLFFTCPVSAAACISDCKCLDHLLALSSGYLLSWLGKAQPSCSACICHLGLSIPCSLPLALHRACSVLASALVWGPYVGRGDQPQHQELWNNIGGWESSRSHAAEARTGQPAEQEGAQCKSSPDLLFPHVKLAQLLPSRCRGVSMDAAQDLWKDRLKATAWSCSAKALWLLLTLQTNFIKTQADDSQLQAVPVKGTQWDEGRKTAFSQ